MFAGVGGLIEWEGGQLKGSPQADTLEDGRTVAIESEDLTKGVTLSSDEDEHKS